MMRIKYTGPIPNLKMCRRDFSQEYDFSKGVCTVGEVDAEKLIASNPACFSIVKATPKKKSVKKAPLETMDTRSE